MTKEEKQALEDAAKVARETADAAHAAAAADGADEALNEAAEAAEEAAQDAQVAADAAVVTPEEEEAPAPDAKANDEDIDFEKELEALAPPAKPEEEAPDKQLTPLQRAERALFFNAEEVKKLGGDPSKVVKPAPVAPVIPVEQPAPFADNVTKDDLAEIEAGRLSRSDAERKVLMHHYKFSIQRTGNIGADLENAYMIAHKGRITRSFDEIRRASYSRPSPGGGPGRKQPVAPIKAPELHSSEKAIMARRGFTMKSNGSWESKRYIMNYDTKQKRWVTTKKA